MYISNLLYLLSQIETIRVCRKIIVSNVMRYSHYQLNHYLGIFCALNHPINHDSNMICWTQNLSLGEAPFLRYQANKTLDRWGVEHNDDIEMNYRLSNLMASHGIQWYSGQGDVDFIFVYQESCLHIHIKGITPKLCLMVSLWHKYYRI